MASVKKDYTPTEDELEFADFAVEIAVPSGKVPAYKSIPSRALKGAVEGLLKFGETVSPAGSPQQIQESQAQRQKFYEENLPLGDNYVGKSLERGLESAPFLLGIPGGGGPIGQLLRALGAGFLGQGAEELGVGPLGQAAAELPALGFPSLGKKIPLKASEKQLGEFARRVGLAEEDIALTRGARGPVKDLAVDISSKGGKTVEKFSATQKNLGRVWDSLRESPAAQASLPAEGQRTLVKKLSEKLDKLPKESRNRVMEDFEDLIGSNFSGDEIINFWQDLNYYIKKGERGVGVLKEDLQKALQQISPELGADFKLTNELYGKFSDLASRMGPNIADSLINAGEKGLVMHAITTGNFPVLKKILGPIAGRQIAREMVTNPRLQNLSKRFVQGAKQGSGAIANRAYEQLVREIGKHSSELAKEMSGFDVEEFIEALPSNSKEEKK